VDNRKYIGMDVHQASISIAVSDAAGKVLDFIPARDQQCWVSRARSAVHQYGCASYVACIGTRDSQQFQGFR
jgi:hypothetical protein